MFQDRPAWYLKISAYWFATSFKWFLALLLIPTKVQQIVPEGEKNGAWGMILAIGAIEATFGPALMGWISDRTSTRWGKRRPWMVLGSILTVLACLILSTAGSFGVLILGYLLLQISDDVATGPYSALIPEFVPQEHRGRASGMMAMLSFVAQIVAAIILVGSSILHINHGAIFGLLAGVNLLAMIIVVTTVKEPAFPEVDRSALDVKSLLKPWKLPNFRWVWFTRFLNAFGFYMLTSFGQYYLKDRVQTFPPLPSKITDPMLAAVLLIVVLSITGIVGAQVGGKLADTKGRKAVIQTAGWIMFFTILAIAWVPIYPEMLGLAFLFGFGYGAFTSADWALAADVVPSADELAKDMGIWQSSVAMPQILNGMLGQGIDKLNSQGPGLGYHVAFTIAAFAFLIGSILVKKVVLPTPSPQADKSS